MVTQLRGGSNFSDRARTIATDSRGRSLSRSVSQFLRDTRELATTSRVEDIAHYLHQRIHPSISAFPINNQVRIIAPLLPVHEIVPQQFLRHRARQRVIVDGRGIYQSFYNPIRSGEDFIVAWYRYPPVLRLPISFVRRDPTPYIRRRVREFLSLSLIHI